MSSPGEAGDALPPVTDRGALLRDERKRRGMSIVDAARQVALSCDQIEQIEDGGTDAFYSAGHKWLAMRKYAHMLGMALPESDAPADETQAGDALTGSVATGRPVARRRWAALAMPGAVLLVAAILLAVPYSMWRPLESVWPFSVTAQAPAPSAIVERGSELPALPEFVTSRAQDAADPLLVALPQDECRPEVSDVDAARWAPAQARLRDTRLFLSSAAEADVCVIDAGRTATRLKLKPGITAIVKGKPPYLLRSPQLPQLRIFFQGLKVRVPKAGEALQLFRAGTARDATEESL